MRIEPHVLSRRVVVNVVIAHSTKGSIKLDREAGLVAYGTADYWDNRKRCPTRHAADEEGNPDFDGHV